MWQVAYADASLDKYEEHLIRRVAELIYRNGPQLLDSALSGSSGYAAMA